MFTKGNFQNIIKQAKNVQEKLEATHAELEKLVFQGQASGDMVVAKVNIYNLHFGPDEDNYYALADPVEVMRRASS